MLNEGEAGVNYRFIEIEKESNSLIVLVKTNLHAFVISSKLFHKMRNKHYFFLQKIGLVALLIDK